MSDETEVKTEKPCFSQVTRTKLVEDEFQHTQKRLARSKVLTVVQFTVFAFNCSEHPEAKDAFHIGYSSLGSDVIVPGGLQTAIAATEQLLAALKAKLQ